MFCFLERTVCSIYKKKLTESTICQEFSSLTRQAEKQKEKKKIATQGSGCG